MQSKLLPRKKRQVGMRPLPEYTKDDEVFLSKIDITRSTIASLKKAAEDYKAKTYSDVERASLNALSKYIYVETGKGKVLAKNYKGFTDKFEYLVDRTASELGIYPTIMDDYELKKLRDNKEPNPVEFLYYTYLLMPNLDPNHFGENMNSVRTAVNTLWDRLSGTKHSSMQSMLYLYSVEGGTGKSVFQNIIREWAKKRGVKSVDTRVPHNQFVGDEFNKNAICFFSDIYEDECRNWYKLNDLIDGGNYVVEKKGEDRYELKSQAFLIGASNFEPMDLNNRRVVNSKVYYGSTKLEPISSHPKAFKLKDGAVDIEYYIPIVDRWITSCPDNGFDYRRYSTGIFSTAAEWYERIDDEYAYVLRTIAEYCDISFFSYDAISVATLTNHINRAIKDGEFADIGEDYKFSLTKINNIVARLYGKGLITIVKDSKQTYQRKYDLSNLYRDRKAIAQEYLKVTKELFEDSSLDYEKEEKVAAIVMDEIIKEKGITIGEDCIDFIKRTGISNKKVDVSITSNWAYLESLQNRDSNFKKYYKYSKEDDCMVRDMQREKIEWEKAHPEVVMAKLPAEDYLKLKGLVERRRRDE